MENVDNVLELKFPEITDEERNLEIGRAQASCAYSELTVIYRAEQSLRRIIAKYGDNPAFQDFAKQMRIVAHINQYKS